MLLRTVTRTQGDNRALKDGTVRPAGFDFDFEEVPVLVTAFRRMVRDLEFDVCEMAFTTYLVAREHRKPFTAVPAFLVRGFHHGAVVTASEGGVEHPKDLEGRSVGVNRGYTVTTGVWARGILRDEYGVDLDTITWVRSGDEHVAEYEPPPNVRHTGEDLGDLVARGELAAAIGIERPGLRPLIPEADRAGFEALRDRGHYPINHLVVVRDDSLSHARAVFDAFRRAKDIYVERLRSGSIAAPTPVDDLHRQVMDITGDDPLPYGIAANEAVVEELVRHALDQRILTRAPDLGSLFAVRE
jgi:4,5-dihydroxyphthalate decarboxylase